MAINKVVLSISKAKNNTIRLWKLKVYKLLPLSKESTEQLKTIDAQGEEIEILKYEISNLKDGLGSFDFDGWAMVIKGIKKILGIG